MRNIFLRGKDAVLGDFGIAKLLEQSPAATQIGTPGYLAPEVWLGQQRLRSFEMPPKTLLYLAQI